MATTGTPTGNKLCVVPMSYVAVPISLQNSGTYVEPSNALHRVIPDEIFSVYKHTKEQNMHGKQEETHTQHLMYLTFCACSTHFGRLEVGVWLAGMCQHVFIVSVPWLHLTETRCSFLALERVRVVCALSP